MEYVGLRNTTFAFWMNRRSRGTAGCSIVSRINVKGDESERSDSNFCMRRRLCTRRWWSAREVIVSLNDLGKGGDMSTLNCTL